MSWVTVIWSMVASACLTLAMVHLLVWFQRRKQWAHLFFALAAVATASMALCEISMFQADSIAKYGMIHRWVHVSYWVVIVSLVCYVRGYMQAGRLWLAWTVCIVRTLALIVNFASPTNLNFREITALRHIQFLGESVDIAQGIPNPWIPVGIISLLLFLVFLADAAFTLWRRRERRSMLILISTMLFFTAASTGQVLFALWKIVVTPPTPSLFFLGVVAAMSWELSRETIRAEQLSDALRERNQWLDLAAESAGVGLWFWDMKASLIWATETGRTLYGFSSHDQITLEKFLSRVHPDDLDWVVQATQKSEREGSDFRHDYRIVLPDGRIRWFRVLAKVLMPPNGEPERMTGVSIDITERKQAEQELAQQSGKLSHLLRVSTLSVLSVSLAHELKRPLGTILRNAEAAEMFLKGPSPDLEEVLAILEDIRTDDLRAGDLIDRMRHHLKRREAAHSLLDVNLLADEVMRLVRQEADSRSIQLNLEIGSSPPPVRGDRVQLQQVLLNLLLNAMDALDSITSDVRRVDVQVRTAGQQIEITVCDTGSGIPDDRLDSVFEPFFTTKPDGLGMGLAISRDIIEAHGGRLMAKNNETGGATFFITLPVALAGDTV